MKGWLTLATAVLLMGCLLGQSPQIALRFQHVPFGVGIGDRGLVAVDLDRNGDDEIVAAASIGTTFGQNNFWYVLDRAGDGLEMRYVSTLYSAGISALRLADIDGDSRPEIVIASGNAILAYDSCTYHEVRRTPTATSAISGLSIVDVDSDGQLEYVFTGSNGLFIYNVNTGALEYSNPSYTGYDVAVGNVDADSDLEIVVGNNTSTGYVLNGRTRAVEWSYPNGFGYIVKIGDVNNDGINEIVGAYAWYRITIFSAYHRSPLYELSADLDVAAMIVSDVNRDGRLEIIYGDGQWGQIWIHDGETLALLGAFNNPEHGVTDIVVADTDGDGTNEVLWGAGYSSTGPDYLFIGDIETFTIVWQSQDLVPPFYAIAVGDLNSDGANEVVYGCVASDSGYEDGIWFVRDGRTWNLLYTHPRLTGFSLGLTRIALANVDDDPPMEIFVNASNGYTGFVICYDGSTFREQYRTTGVDGSQIKAIAIADVDRNGSPELVLTGNREHTGATGVYAYIHNARTGALIWRSVNLGLSYWASLDYLRVGNVDTDPQLELVIGERDGQIIIYDGATRLQQLITGARQVSALELADLDGNGIEEILVGTTNGALYIMNPTNGNIAQGLGNYGSQINGLQVANLIGSAEPDILFCAGDRLHIRYFDPAARRYLVWQSPVLGSNVGALDSLRVADIDNNGTPEILLNVGFALRVYRLIDSLPQGDVNRDGCVDDADLLCLLYDFGRSGSNLLTDLNRDGTVDDADLLMILFNFGQGC